MKGSKIRWFKWLCDPVWKLNNHIYRPSSRRTCGLTWEIPITCQYSMNIMGILPRNVGPVTAQLWPTSLYHWSQREITLRKAKRVKRRSIELEKTKREIERANGSPGTTNKDKPTVALVQRRVWIMTLVHLDSRRGQLAVLLWPSLKI